MTHSSSISIDQQLAWCAWTDKTRCRTVQSVQGLGTVMQWIYGLGAHRMTGIPIRAVVATFTFSTAPRQKLGLIQHPVIGYDSMVPYLRSLIRSTVWNLMKHKDKFTFISYKTRWHYIPHLTVECTKNVIANEFIPTFEMEIATSFPWTGVCVLKHSHHLIAQKQECINYARRIQHVIKIKHAQGGSILYILSPHYVNKKNIQWYNC